jgi:hypothetical protein
VSLGESPGVCARRAHLQSAAASIQTWCISSLLPPPFLPLTSFQLRQPQPQLQHLRIIRRAQARNRIPARSGRKARSATTLIAALGDVVQDVRVRIKDRVDEADAALAGVVAGLVDQGEDGAGGRRGSGGAVHEGEVAVDSDDIVCAVGLEEGQEGNAMVK